MMVTEVSERRRKMDGFTIGFWGISLVLFITALRKDKEQAKITMKKTRGMMKSMIGDIIGIIFLIGFILAVLPPETIEKFMGTGNTYIATVVAAFIGSVTLIPAFAAFPLVGSFVDAGASIVPGVAFLTTLTMVGVVTFPLEKRAFGSKFALTRNTMSFFAAVIIATLMGVILG